MELTNDIVSKFAGGTYDCIRLSGEPNWMRGDIKTATIVDGGEGASALRVQGDNSHIITKTGDQHDLNVDEYLFRFNRGPYDWDADGRLVMFDYLMGPMGKTVIVITPPDCELRDTYTHRDFIDEDLDFALFDVTESRMPDSDGNFRSQKFVGKLN